MELKDVAAMHIPSQPAPPAAAGFGDEYGEPARRYALRRPGKRPYLAAAVVSAFWLGGAAAFVAGYLGLDNVFLLPHMGSQTIEARTEMGLEALANIEAHFEGRPLPYPVC